MEMFLQLTSNGLFLPGQLRPQRRLGRLCHWTVPSLSQTLLSPCLCPTLRLGWSSVASTRTTPPPWVRVIIIVLEDLRGKMLINDLDSYSETRGVCCQSPPTEALNIHLPHPHPLQRCKVWLPHDHVGPVGEDKEARSRYRVATQGK